MPQLAVLGMHRSGTSLVARYCVQAGISAGPSQDMLAAGEDNPEGFFEHRELVAINDALLRDVGHSWANPGVVERFTDPSLRSTAEALLARLREGGGGQFLIKDPRLCVTAGLWLPLLDELSTVYVFRPAFAVARSLAVRNRFPLQLGLLLWEFYNRAALRNLNSESSLAVAYDDLVDDDAALPGIHRWLLERGFQCTEPTTQTVLKPRLRHAGAEIDDASAAIMSTEQRLLEAQCRALCHGDAPGEVAPMTEEALSRLRDLAASLEPLASLIETDLARQSAESLCDERTRERDTSLAALEELQQEHRSLAGAHDEERRLHGKAAETLRALESEHRQLAGAHEREVSEHRALIREHNDLQEQQRQLQAKADYLFLTLTEAFRGLLVFEHSLLGRLQRRLRGAYRLLTGRRGRNSRYEDVLEYADAHFDEYALEKPEPPQRKIDMLGDVVRYVLRNPSGSARSFSWARLRRAAQVFFGSSSADLAVWVNARFPNDDARRLAFDPAALDVSLDTLEFDFPRVEQPRVSIIVPVYNNYRVTVNCLRAVREHSDGIAYELILADDSSTDLTSSITERIGNLVVSRTPENLRFLRNCKLAARRARGECLLFLNNDTEVTDGWLAGLLEPLEDAAVGVVGPKLLFADGKLQEAGGIVWDDASAWNFGRADDPEHPAYNYRREVDYVSGACLLVRRAVWEQLGGFDERFAPAYYEDADLCFAARAAGWRVVYEPHSEVFHFEGVSNGTDLNAGVKQHQVNNRAVFLDKWRQVLEAAHFPNGEQVVLARDRSRGRPRILVIDHYVPHYDKDAGGRSTDQYLRLFLELGFHVQFMGANFFPHQPYTRRLQALGVEVLVGESIARSLDSWFAEHAPYLDEIWVHRPHVAEQFLPHLERLKPRPKLVFVGHDLHYLRVEREAALNDSAALREEAASWKQREIAVCARMDRVYYFSQAELDELSASVAADKLRRIPLYAMRLFALPPYRPAQPSDLLFVGGYNHPPNVDAAEWLVREILPLVRAQVPQVRLHLVGSNAGEQVKALAGNSVIFHGYLSDAALNELYRDIAVAVVPLRYGAGVKGKVIEAIAQNVPLVTTDIGAEGIPGAESVMWVDNTATGIAAKLVALLSGATDVSEVMSRYEAWLQANFAAERALECLREDMATLLEREEGDRCDG